MAIDIITHAELLAQVHYDPETGVFSRYKLVSGPKPKGGGIGSIDKEGYRIIWLKGRIYRANRLAWFYVHGTWPTKVIDHINGQPSDDRIANLRDVSRSTNCQNRRTPRRNSKSGLIGVCWHKGKQKWTATIQVNGKWKSLGGYDTPQEAHAAYLGAKRMLHPGCTI